MSEHRGAAAQNGIALGQGLSAGVQGTRVGQEQAGAGPGQLGVAGVSGEQPPPFNCSTLYSVTISHVLRDMEREGEYHLRLHCPQTRY